MNFRYDVSVMILLRINIFSKIIRETSYRKLTIKPHKLYYKYNLLVSLLNSNEVITKTSHVTEFKKATFDAQLQIFRNTDFNYLKCAIHHDSIAIHSLSIHKLLNG